MTDDALRDLRAGADIVALQRTRSALPKGARAAVLTQVAAFFEALQAGRRERPAALQQQLDAALQGVLAEPVRSADEQARAVAALVGLWRNLCPGALWGVRRVLAATGLYRWVWHPALFDLALHALLVWALSRLTVLMQ